MVTQENPSHRPPFPQSLVPRAPVDRLEGAEECRFGAGEILFREGQPANRLYLIEEGGVALETHVPGKGDVVMATVLPGQGLGVVVAGSAVRLAFSGPVRPNPRAPWS